MRYYAGLDVSLEETAICIVDELGKIERELRIERACCVNRGIYCARPADGANWP